MKVDEICKIVCNSPAPRFYVSVDNALNVYRAYKKTGELNIGRSKSRDMYMEIFARYEKLHDQYKGVAFNYSLMDQVLNSPAPSFYMEESTALDFYYRAMRDKRRRSRK